MDKSSLQATLNSKRRPIIRSTLLQMAWRISVVILVVTLLSYWHIAATLEEATKDKLLQYIRERGAKESQIFELAESNHRIFKSEFLQAYQLEGSVAAGDWERLFVAQADGSMRLRPEAYDAIRRADGTIGRHTTAYVGANAPLTDADFRRRLVIGWKLVDQFAPAWTQQFANLYVHSPENFNIVNWPGLRWADQAAKGLDVSTEEWVTITTPANNPLRQPVWTGLYYDPTAKDWMVSLETPIDWHGRHLLSVGHDVLLNKLFDRVFNDRLHGATNFIVRMDGRLIAHPNEQQRLSEKLGVLMVSDASTPGLQAMVAAIDKTPASHVNAYFLVDDKENDALLAVTRLAGTGWRFVTVYPKSLITSTALQAAEFVLLLSLISLVLELLALYLVIKGEVVRPLKMFLSASEEVSQGHHRAVADGEVPLPLSSRSEIGVLAHAFQSMSQRIFELLEGLERQVEKRTQDLNQSLMEQKAIFENGLSAMLFIDAEQQIRRCNRAAEDLLGCSAAELIQQPLNQLRNGEGAELISGLNAAALRESGGRRQGEVQLRRHDGRLLWCLYQANLVDRVGAGDDLVLSLQDISERREAELVLARNANQDALTGLANRRSLDLALETAARKALRDFSPLSVALVDVDCFKLYNDNYGHGKGDEALRQVAQQLAQAARRPHELVARYGGEEFAILLPDEADPLALLDRVRESVEKLGIPHAHSTAASVVTISIGVVTQNGGDALSPQALLELADAQLYEAKRAGRNRVMWDGRSP